MLTKEEIDEWEEDFCPACGMVVPKHFLCEDYNYCEYYLTEDEGEDE
jgi:hypothetical protein